MSNSPQVLTPEILVPRLGDYLIERGLITSEQLTAALQQQAAIRKTQPTAPLIGQILIESGVLDKSALDQAITEQVLQLRFALTENNRQLEQRVRERTADLEKALARLSELNQLKSNFLANISHELRTPLTHLKGYLELMQSGDLGTLNADQNDALATMARASERLGRLIEDLILFATSEHQQLPIVMETLDLVGLSNEIVEQMRPKALDQKLTLALQAPEKCDHVYGDREKIGWVIYQFIDNAIKFTPSGGTITVELTMEDLDVAVTVSDNGIGIPENRLKEIFEPFHQLDGSSTRKYGGTGLGLSLANKIIASHDTVILVSSELGKGSHFSFKLKRVFLGD